MDKKTIGLLVVGLLLVAYPGLTWWTGRQVEANLAEQYKVLEGVPFVKIVKRDFEKGFASSQDTVTFEVFGDLTRSLEKTRKDNAAALAPANDQDSANEASPDKAVSPPAAPMKPIQFTVRTQYKHGPFADGKFAAAVADSELVLDAAAQREIGKVLGDKKPITAHTVFNFTGGGTSTVTSPAFATTLPGEPGNKAQLSWHGFNATVDFAKGMRSYSMRGDAPRLEIQDEKGTHMVMSGTRIEGEQARLFDDEPLLYSGTQKFSIAQIDISGTGTEQKPVALKNVVYDIAMPVSGDFLDMSAKMGAASLQVAQQEYGPARYEISFRHLHARTVAKLYRALMKAYGDPSLFAPGGNPKAAFAPLAEPAMELLKHNPEFRIDRISFKSEHGEASVSGHVKFDGAKPEDFSNPMMLIAKLNAGADLALPEAMMADMGAAKAANDEEKAMRREMFAAQLDALHGEGYISREGGLIKSKIDFKAGQLMVNGKPFDPSALRSGQGGAPADAAAGMPPGMEAAPLPGELPAAATR